MNSPVSLQNPLSPCSSSFKKQWKIILPCKKDKRKQMV